MARSKRSRTSAFVPRVVFTLAVASVIPALTPTSCGGDTVTVAAGGFSGVAAVAMGGFSGVAAVAMSGFGGGGGTTGTDTGGAGGAGGATGTGGGTGTTATPPPGVAAVAMQGFASPPADLESLLATAVDAPLATQPRGAKAKKRGAKRTPASRSRGRSRKTKTT